MPTLTVTTLPTSLQPLNQVRGLIFRLLTLETWTSNPNRPAGIIDRIALPKTLEHSCIFKNQLVKSESTTLARIIQNRKADSFSAIAMILSTNRTLFSSDFAVLLSISLTYCACLSHGSARSA